jgi:hypothetical protein
MLHAVQAGPIEIARLAGTLRVVAVTLGVEGFAQLAGNHLHGRQVAPEDEREGTLLAAEGEADDVRHQLINSERPPQGFLGREACIASPRVCKIGGRADDARVGMQLQACFHSDCVRKWKGSSGLGPCRVWQR